MSRRFAGHPTLFCAALLCALLAPCASAQENAPAQDTPPVQAPGLPETEENEGLPTLYEKGDQTFSIDVGAVFPLFFSTKSGTIPNKVNIGGSGRLAYDRFITPHITVGGEFGGMFSSTVGENMLFQMPFGIRGAYHFLYRSFEFPVGLMVGGCTQSYDTQNYLGIIVKPQAGAFWRYSSEWSFGLSANWWWVPEWTDEEASVYGNYLELTLGARYHF